MCTQVCTQGGVKCGAFVRVAGSGNGLRGSLPPRDRGHCHWVNAPMGCAALRQRVTTAEDHVSTGFSLRLRLLALSGGGDHRSVCSPIRVTDPVGRLSTGGQRSRFNVLGIQGTCFTFKWRHRDPCHCFRVFRAAWPISGLNGTRVEIAHRLQRATM